MDEFKRDQERQSEESGKVCVCVGAQMATVCNKRFGSLGRQGGRGCRGRTQKDRVGVGSLVSWLSCGEYSGHTILVLVVSHRSRYNKTGLLLHTTQHHNNTRKKQQPATGCSRRSITASAANDTHIDTTRHTHLRTVIPSSLSITYSRPTEPHQREHQEHPS